MKFLKIDYSLFDTKILDLYYNYGLFLSFILFLGV